VSEHTSEPVAVPEVETLVEWLDRWLDTGIPDRFISAATRLVVEHEGWLHRKDFVTRCVELDPSDRTAVVRWREVRRFLDEGVRGSSSEFAVLEFGWWLATDRLSLSGLGSWGRHAFARAFAGAMRIG
jgi:hypothetical protein